IHHVNETNEGFIGSRLEIKNIDDKCSTSKLGKITPTADCHADEGGLYVVSIVNALQIDPSYLGVTTREWGIRHSLLVNKSPGLLSNGTGVQECDARKAK